MARPQPARRSRGTPANQGTGRRLTNHDQQTSQQLLTRWGVQNHPDGTGLNTSLDRHAARDAYTFAAANNELTWQHILLKEVYEALAEHDPARLRAELIKVAAVAAAWTEAIDRRADALGAALAGLLADPGSVNGIVTSAPAAAEPAPPFTRADLQTAIDRFSGPAPAVLPRYALIHRRNPAADRYDLYELVDGAYRPYRADSHPDNQPTTTTTEEKIDG